MRAARFAVIVLVGCCWLGLHAESKDQPVVVTGKLSRAMAIGGESTGWTIELDSEITIAGKAVHSIEIAYRKRRSWKSWRTSMSAPKARSGIGKEWKPGIVSCLKSPPSKRPRLSEVRADVVRFRLTYLHPPRTIFPQ